VVEALQGEGLGWVDGGLLGFCGLGIFGVGGDPWVRIFLCFYALHGAGVGPALAHSFG
jgi:hypothetical protein